MNMKFHAWARGLLLSSFALTTANGYAAVIGGIDFADNAFADRVLSTDFTGDFLGCGGNTASTLDQAVTGSNFNVWASYGDHEMFAGADGDYNSDAPPNQYIEIGFVDNAIVNDVGNDLVVFELGARNAFRVALDKFSIQNPYAPGAVSVVTFPVAPPEAITGYCTAPTMAYVDLSDLGVLPNETVYRVFISSPLMENGDVVWNDRAYPYWGVPEIPAVAALNSVDKANYAPEVELGNDVIVSRPNSLILTSDDIEVIDDSTPNDELTYLWTQTDGVAATISSTNTLATTITFPDPGNYTFRLTVTDDSAPPASAFDTLIVQVTAPDSTDPSMPANFAAEVLSNTGVSLTWAASTDNVAIKQYNIYRDDVLLTSTTNLFYKDFRVEPGEEYSYFIRAVDPAGNLSAVTATQTRTLSARLLARRTAAGADDAEEHEDGVVVINDGDLELVEDGVANGTQTVGVRFQNITVPAGATIVKAWLDFMADETSADVTSLVIHGIAEDNPVPFAATNGNISLRPITNNSAQWSDVPGWSVVGDTYEAVDMADVVQELINDGGWASGQAMAFVITGSGRRVAEPYEGGNTRGPRLFIEYQAPEPVNQPPVVTVGAVQPIELPTNSVSLEGSVTDDNLTGVLTLTWTMQSGPGTVTFSAPDATVTDVTFSQAGTYVLRLTASDDQYSPYDEVTVVVSPQPNRAPSVNVGADRAVSQQNALELSATVTDDGISGEALTYLWSAVSGPGTVTFDPDNEAETSVTFSQEGSYVLRLTADDGPLDASDTLTVTVSVPDLVAPSQPQNLDTEEIVIGTVELTWDAATDAVGVVGYNLYRDNVLLSQVNGTTYTDTGLTPDTEFDYEVSALDAAENESPRSAVSIIRTEFVPDELESLSIALTRFDGAEQAQNGTMSVGAYPIDLVYTSAAGAGTQQVGLRFNNVTVPSRARIARAYLRFCAIEPDSGAASLNFAALDQADAEAFGTEAHHLSGRATIGTVAWNSVPAWADEQCYDSPDITLLAQLLVNNDDWRSGNSMGFKITGSGARRAYRGGTTNAPRLILEHFGGNQAPDVDAGGTASVRLPSTLSLNGSALDDPQDTLSYQWSSVTVPVGGVVTFDNATAAATNASFTVAGNYTLRLTVSDGEKSGSADLAVSVQPPNQTPVVNAGANLAVERPATAALAGTVSDSDEGPDPMTYQWSRTSGPGVVTFTAANALATNAEFSASGTYVLRLTVDDGADEVYDELTVEVTSRPNATPVIDAGTNRRVSMPNALSLAATMEDDGINGTPSLIWERVSGPGTVTFSDATALNPTATFSQSGNYVLRLTAVDGAFTVTDTLSVQVTEPDLEAPSQPVLQVERVGLGMVRLSWTATDNVGITAYEIHRDGALLTQVTGNSHTDVGLSTGIEYDYQVLAIDESGNESALSAQQSITLTGAPAEVESLEVALLRNDGAEQAQNGNMNLGTYPIDLVYTTVGSAGTQQVGLLFRDIGVPSGAYISRAYLRFCSYDNASGATSLNIAVLDEADPVNFAETANHLTGRNTIGSVAWNDVPAWTAGQCYNSPDITLLTQLAVNNEDWHFGNNMGFKITGTGTRRSYYGNHPSAPQLVLQYFGGNQAPLANAGADASVRLPAAAALSGSFEDDGETDEITVQWSQVSGTGTTTFADATALSTNASFSAAGTYVLALAVNDGDWSVSDTVTITVLPANQPPTVSAGVDQEIVLPDNTADLVGAVSDDAITTPLTSTWTKVSGPGTVSFANASATGTTATFSESGVYVLRLTANDGALSAQGDVTITVSPQPNAAPLVSVGADWTVNQINTLNISASVTDDGISGELTLLWTVASGPGAVTFTPNNAATTAVTFAAAGSYELRLTADDGEFTPSDTLLVEVAEADLTAPDTPEDLSLSQLAISAVEVSWSAATDNVSVVGYRLYRDDALLTQLNVTEYVDTGLTAGTDYTYEVTAVDAAGNESSRSAPNSITTPTVPTGLSPVAFALVRANGAEQAANGDVRVGRSNTLDLVDEETAGNQIVGLRFTGLTVPSGAMISRAYLRFCANNSDSAAAFLSISALNDSDANADAFLEVDNHLSELATIGNVSWNNVEHWDADECYNSPDISLLVQLVINDTDWRAGYSMGFLITGTGTRRAYPGGTNDNVPQLVIEYFGGNQVPTVSAGTNRTVVLGQTLPLTGSAADDGEVSPLTYRWSQFSTTVTDGLTTFTAANSINTNATFSAAGNYVLQLSASDGEYTVSHRINVVVTTATSGGDSGGTDSGGGGGGGGSLDLWSLLALMLAGGIRFGSVKAGRRRLSGGCAH